MTFLEEGDFVFITSDGVSDNFDPVVGKFCSIRKTNEERAHPHAEIDPFTGANATGSHSDSNNSPIPQFHKTKSAPTTTNLTVNCSSWAQPSIPFRTPMAILPCVDSFERHELMLLRLADVIENGLNCYNRFTKGSSLQSSQHNFINSTVTNNINNVTAADLCKNLIQFSYLLSAAKRRTLENPELYGMRMHTKTEERLRRKMIRNMIMDMPGKLDHASVVAYRVGKWSSSLELGHYPSEEATMAIIDCDGVYKNVSSQAISPYIASNEKYETIDDGIPGVHPAHIQMIDNGQCDKAVGVRGNLSLYFTFTSMAKREALMSCSDHQSPSHKSPYEDLPVEFGAGLKTSMIYEQPNGTNRVRPSSKKRHARGSQSRHTLGVDVNWLKRLIRNKAMPEGSNEAINSAELQGQTVTPSEDQFKESQNEYAVSGNGNPSFPVVNVSESWDDDHHTPPLSRTSGQNFSLRKLRALLKQTRGSSGDYEVNSVPTPSLQKPTIPLLGISALKSPPSTGRRPNSTRV